MKKKRMMTTIPSFLNTVILSWEKLKGKLKERHIMSPLRELAEFLLREVIHENGVHYVENEEHYM
jgi:hypothetical protein